MPPKQAVSGSRGGAHGYLRADNGTALETAVRLREKTVTQRMLGAQALWVIIAIAILAAAVSLTSPYFLSVTNFYNITRNSAFIAINALGATVVIIAAGIDLSIGSIMGLVGICSGLTLAAGAPWYVAVAVGFMAGGLVGGINGVLVAYVGLPPFVVTLGMLSAARSAAIVLSGERVVSDFGRDASRFEVWGGGTLFGISSPVWFAIVLGIFFAILLNMTAWGRHVSAIGGNENAARVTGVPVKWIKMQTYIVSALCASLAAMLTIGWTGSAVNSLGSGYELQAIAASVIGGANLLGGDGSALGALAGSVLIVAIGNALLMAGVDSNWQGLFIGGFIVAAVLLERIRRVKRE